MEALMHEKELSKATINGREIKFVEVLSFGARTWDVRVEGEKGYRVFADYDEAVQNYYILVARRIMGIEP